MKKKDPKLLRTMREIKKYKGIIKREEDKEDIDWEIYLPENTPTKMRTIYGCFELEENIS